MSVLPPQLPHGELRELLPDVFMVTGATRPVFGGQQLAFSRNMTVIRHGEELTLVNTLRLDEAGLARLDELGRVVNVVKLGSYHGRDDAFYIGRYGARMWAFAGMPHERGVVTERELLPGGEMPFEGATAFVFETSSSVEGLLLAERHGGVLMSCDSLQNWADGADEFFDEATAASMAQLGFFRKAGVGIGWLNMSKPEVVDFVRVKELGFRHLLSAHGAALLDEAHAALSATFSELFGV